MITILADSANMTSCTLSHNRPESHVPRHNFQTARGQVRLDISAIPGFQIQYLPVRVAHGKKIAPLNHAFIKEFVVAFRKSGALAAAIRVIAQDWRQNKKQTAPEIQVKLTGEVLVNGKITTRHACENKDKKGLLQKVLTKAAEFLQPVTK